MLQVRKWDTIDFKMNLPKWSSLELCIEQLGVKETTRIRDWLYEVKQEPGVYTYTINIITPKKVIMWEPDSLLVSV